MPSVRALAITIAVVITATACDRLPPTAMAPSPVLIRLPAPDPSFRLSAAERATVLREFDADALERLLAAVQPDKRAEILAFFQPRSEEGPRLGHLVAFNEPELQPLLEEVWAPFWANATDEEIEQDVYGMPGRLIAKQRRAERARTEGPAQPE
jgi:hypothetical protein